MPLRVPRSSVRTARGLTLLAFLAAGVGSASGGAGPPGGGLAELLAPPGTRQVGVATMLHPDLTVGYDRRAPLDSVVHTLENGARCRRVLGRDSAWVADFTWVYPHRGLPARWYDVNDLLRVGDSLGLGDTSDIVLTFGTLRLGVRAGDLDQARTEVEHLRPSAMPRALVGRLRLKLERARERLQPAPGGPTPGP